MKFQIFVRRKRTANRRVYCRLAQDILCNSSDIDAEIAELRRETEIVAELSRKAVYENARTAIARTEFTERNNGYLERYSRAVERIAELEALKRERLGKHKVLEFLIRSIENQSPALAEFDERLWLAVIDCMVVSADGKIRFKFKNGTEVTV